jgi:hypothetical protein
VGWGRVVWWWCGGVVVYLLRPLRVRLRDIIIDERHYHCVDLCGGEVVNMNRLTGGGVRRWRACVRAWCGRQVRSQ